MAKLARRKDIDRLGARVDGLSEAVSGHVVTLGRMGHDLRGLPGAGDLERVSALLEGVRVALERQGGNTLPAFRTDVLALRDQMGEFRRELSDYRGALMRLTRWLDEVLPAPVKTKRRYNRRRKGASEDQPQVEISAIDAALHNGEPEIEK